MLALSIRQPYVELILRGIKTVEYRTRPTRIIGRMFYIYAARQPGEREGFTLLGAEPGELPTGLLVGTAMISHCTPPNEHGRFQWHLTAVKRLPRPRKPNNMPQPVWFMPF